MTVRLNFTLNVASQAQNVEVTVAADTLLATSSPTIGQVMSEKKVSELPVVGNNVLDMLSVLGGIDNLVPTGANPQAGARIRPRRYDARRSQRSGYAGAARRNHGQRYTLADRYQYELRSSIRIWSVKSG